jgi:hypothetical protein
MNVVLNENFNLTGDCFSKCTEFVKETPVVLGIGVVSFGLLSVAYHSRRNTSFIAANLSENLKEIAEYSYIKFLEIFEELGSTRATENLDLRYLGRRDQIIKNLSKKVISLEGIDLDKAGDYLSVLLEDDDRFSFADQSMERRQNFSLKALCRNIDELSNEQLPESIDIAEKLIESLKDETGVSELISFCLENSSRVQSLFTIVHYLRLDDFQNAHLEPFNKVFSSISLDQAPATINQLDLSLKDIRGIDLSRFEFLKILNLDRTAGLSVSWLNYTPLFNAIPPEVKVSIRVLSLCGVNVTGFDFSSFTNLKTLDLSYTEGLTAAQFSAIPSEVKASIEDLNLSYVDITGFDFSGFINLKALNLCGSTNKQEINLINYQLQAKASIKTLGLNWKDVTGFDFSGFTNLKTLLLECPNEAFIAAQFRTIAVEVKASIEHLVLMGGLTGVTDFDLSDFIHLKTLKLSYILLKAEQFNAIPVEVRASIETLDLSYVDTLKDFDFAGFTNLKSLCLNDYCGGLTAAQFNAIPNKASIETLDLSSVGVTGFDFSGFTNLKSLCLNDYCGGLTAAQFNAIPNKASIETLDLSSVGVTGFDFSGFTNLKALNLMNSKNLTTTQLNAIPEQVKASIEALNLMFVDITNFDLSGFTGRIVR